MTERAAVANASDRKQIKSAKQKEKWLERQRAADLHAVMMTVEGRRFYWALLGETGLNESVMQAGPEMIQYHAGRQDFGHKLYVRVITKEPDLYLLMQQEAIDEQQREIRATPIEEEPPEPPDEDSTDG